MAFKARKYSEEHRKGILAKWRASGLSQAEFSRQEAIPEWAISEWKRREAQGVLRSSKNAASTFGRTDRKYPAPPKAQADLVEHWRKIVGDFAVSGLTAAEFAKRHGVNIHTFKRWRKKVAASSPKRHRKAPANKSPFIAVEIAHPRTDGVVEITLSLGATILVTDRTPLSLLCKILRTLEKPC